MKDLIPLRGGVRLVLLGAPGSGKGTQGILLAEHYGIPHIATGEMIRDHIARGTELGREVEAAIAGGNFASDQDVLKLIGERLAQQDAQRGYILDGFPRDLAQARAFDEYSHVLSRPLDAVVELAVDEAVLLARLSGRLVCPTCGESYQVDERPPRVAQVCDRDGTALVRRPDDEPGAIAHRLDVYHTLTEPLIEHYRARGLYVGVNAEARPVEVFESICLVLEGRN